MERTHPEIEASADGKGEHLAGSNLDAYCRGAFDDEEVNRVEHHLRECPDCTRRVVDTVRAMVRARR